MNREVIGKWIGLCVPGMSEGSKNTASLSVTFSNF